MSFLRIHAAARADDCLDAVLVSVRRGHHARIFTYRAAAPSRKSGRSRDAHHRSKWARPFTMRRLKPAEEEEAQDRRAAIAVRANPVEHAVEGYGRDRPPFSDQRGAAVSRPCCSGCTWRCSRISERFSCASFSSSTRSSRFRCCRSSLSRSASTSCRRSC